MREHLIICIFYDLFINVDALLSLKHTCIKAVNLEMSNFKTTIKLNGYTFRGSNSVFFCLLCDKQWHILLLTFNVQGPVVQN